MIEIKNLMPDTWAKDLWIAKKKETIKLDEEGNEIVEYEEPIPYKFNYQPVSSNAEIAEFGEKSSETKKAVIPISYKDAFREFDVAYLEGATPDGENVNGMNANYRLLPPRNGNAAIIIYFQKITGK